MEPQAATMPAQPDIFAPDAVMLILTWVTFFSLLFLLQKFAWKPILATLQKREETIRQSLESADQINLQLAEIEKSRDEVLSKAHKEAQEIIEQSRKRAQELAHSIEEKAKTHAHEIVEAAHLQVEGEKERLTEALRMDSAKVAIGLAAKIMNENMDTDKNRRLVENYIKEI